MSSLIADEDIKDLTCPHGLTCPHAQADLLGALDGDHDMCEGCTRMGVVAARWPCPHVVEARLSAG